MLSVSVIIDYENDIKASTGAFELVYKGAFLKTNESPSSVDNEGLSSGLSQALVNVNDTPDKEKRDIPSIIIKDISCSMRQVLMDLLNILKKEKLRKQIATKEVEPIAIQKIHQSVETITSISTIQTQTIISKIAIFNDEKRKNLRNQDTNTMKYSKEYILNLLKKKITNSRSKQ